MLEREESEVIDGDEGKNNVEVDEKPIIALRHLTKLWWFEVTIKKKGIIILINLGSTQNFLDPWVAKRTSCLVHETSNSYSR